MNACMHACMHIYVFMHLCIIYVAESLPRLHRYNGLRGAVLAQASQHRQS